MKCTSLLLILIALTFNAYAKEGGTGVGSGGDAIICKTAHQVCVRRTPTSERICKIIKIKGPVTAEYYVATAFATGSEVEYLKTWRGLSYKDTLDRLFKKLEKAPFAKELQDVKNRLGSVETNGLGTTFAIGNINDSTIPFEVEKNKCGIAQAVARSGDFFYYNEKIWKMFAKSEHANQQALMDFHEYLYAYGKDVMGHQTSTESQRLIVWLLMRDLNDEQLQYLLKTYHFIK